MKPKKTRLLDLQRFGTHQLKNWFFKSDLQIPIENYLIFSCTTTVRFGVSPSLRPSHLKNNKIIFYIYGGQRSLTLIPTTFLFTAAAGC